MFFLSKFLRETSNLGTWTTYWRSYRWSTTLTDGFWKAHNQLSICLNWMFFAICYCSGVMRQNMYRSAVFTGGQPLFTNFTWTERPPTTIVDIRKLETLGYPMVNIASLCIPSFWHNTRVWRTDRRTDEFAVALPKLALRHAVKTRSTQKGAYQQPRSTVTIMWLKQTWLKVGHFESDLHQKLIVFRMVCQECTL